MFWNNDELGIDPTHFFSKLYENDLTDHTVVLLKRYIQQ